MDGALFWGIMIVGPFIAGLYLYAKRSGPVTLGKMLHPRPRPLLRSSGRLSRAIQDREKSVSIRQRSRN